MRTLCLRPAREGLIVRDPVTHAALAPEGESKPLNTYWRRRLRDGDVVECGAVQTPPKQRRAKASQSKDVAAPLAKEG